MFIYWHHYTGYRVLHVEFTHNYPNIMDIQHKISTTCAVDKIKSYIFLRAQGKNKNPCYAVPTNSIYHRATIGLNREQIIKYLKTAAHSVYFHYICKLNIMQYNYD